jgi:antitoxin CcdA
MRIRVRILSAIITWRHITQALYDFDAPKKATNLSLNSDLLKRTRALNINLSATLEQALIDKLKSIEAKKWVKENKNSIQAYNDFVDDNGCFGDEFREF